MTTPERALVLGLGVANKAVVTSLVGRGSQVIAIEDHPRGEQHRWAESTGVDLVEAPDIDTLDRLLSEADVLVASPGIPESHPAFAAAERAGVPVDSEFDLAADLTDRPMVAVTGTDGKTTVVEMVCRMLIESGSAAVAVGNLDVPLVAAVADSDTEVFVVEASSFRLSAVSRFRPTVATWLNFGPDHLDVHSSLESYETAKAAIWRSLAVGGTAVANLDDPVVMRNVDPDRHTLTFGLADGDYRVERDTLVGPAGDLVAVDALPRQLPHDIANALAAAATASAAGADLAAVQRVLGTFEGLPHRVELVGERDGVSYYDDSKATVPHATVSALRGFSSVVLIAGGRNKGVDLSPLADEAERLAAVVSIGEAAPEIRSVFAGRVPVQDAGSMAEAVRAARDIAERGDTVLLSPACASFDWYVGYAARGDDFRSEVEAL